MNHLHSSASVSEAPAQGRYRRRGLSEQNHMKRPRRRRDVLRPIASALLISGILGAYAFPLAMPTLAAGSGWSPGALDVDPETASGPAGTTFTLTATVYDHDGDVYAGPGTDTEVRFYFTTNSPNDPHSGYSPT